MYKQKNIYCIKDISIKVSIIIIIILLNGDVKKVAEGTLAVPVRIPHTHGDGVQSLRCTTRRTVLAPEIMLLHRRMKLELRESRRKGCHMCGPDMWDGRTAVVTVCGKKEMVEVIPVAKLYVESGESMTSH